MFIERMRDNEVRSSCRITLTVEQHRRRLPHPQTLPACSPATTAPPWSSSLNAAVSTRLPEVTPSRSPRRKKRITAIRIRTGIGRILGATLRTRGEIICVPRRNVDYVTQKTRKRDPRRGGGGTSYVERILIKPHKIAK